MNAELRDYIYTHKYEQPVIQRLVEMLPAGDEPLDELTGGLVESADMMGFNFVVTAALVGERRVDGRHFREGASLAFNGDYLAAYFWHMQGEKVEALLHALNEHLISPIIAAHGLLSVAGWCRQQGEERWPDALLRAARKIMRIKLKAKVSNEVLHALAAYLADPDVIALAYEHQGKVALTDTVHECAARLGEAFVNVYRMPMIGFVPEAARTLGVGTHLRRSLPKLGRNDPCHCGSDRKYKRCCEEKDKERGRSLSVVEGKTQAELEESREPHLTPDNIMGLNRGQVRRLDPLKIHPEVMPHYLLVLGSHGLLDTAASVFENEKLGLLAEEPSHGVQAWHAIMKFAVWRGREDVVGRMIQARFPSGEIPEGELDFGAELLRRRSRPDEYLEKLEQVALEALTAQDAERQENLAYALASPLHPALSLLMVRGMLPVISKRTAMNVLVFAQKLRDQLLLPAEDPFFEILERRFMDAATASQGKDAQKLREANDRLQVKSGQVNELREQLEQARRDLRLKEKQEKRGQLPGHATNPEAQTLNDLREKVRSLKTLINGHAQERSELRQELTAAYTELQTVRQQQMNAGTGAAQPQPQEGGEDSLLVSVTLEETQPLRLVEYPKKFHETLERMPRHVSRAALVLLGRLSAGEPAAFVGVVALRVCPDVLRVRVGADHRLLFRLHGSTLEVVDFINRRDLERRVKAL